MSERPSFVYFVQAGDGGPIKIGISRNIPGRLLKMQTDTPAVLKLLAAVPGARAQELEIHGKLGAHRLEGEWFSPHADVLALMDRQKEAAGSVEFLVPVKLKDRPAKCPLHAWRLRNNITLSDLAERFGVSQGFLSDIENGKHRPSWPTMETIHRLTNGEISPNDFAPWLRKKSEAA